ncbi:MAG: phosphoribosylglycinamide formyltransferase [Eggerthellaceae bacterium]|nr:phosphoribosylglycinamide formyltransferase [Eggerthellaceae bacterium]
MEEGLRIGVLISGGGSNLQAIIDAIGAGSLDAEIAVVISSRPDAYGLMRAREAGIPTCSLTKELYRDPAKANELIASEFARAGADYIVMAGYMRKVTVEVLRAFPDRVLNLHPALLPSFQGAHGIEDAFNAGVKVTGVTVHFANEAYDKGPIIAQRAVMVEEDDTLEALTERIHAAEHELYPEVLSLLAAGRIVIDEDRKVRVLGRSPDGRRSSDG